MKYVIRKDTKTPAYQQLYLQLREDIVRGIYPTNTKLPSKRVIAGDCGVSLVTAEHAYDLLCGEGYIDPRERSGYFVIFQQDEGFAAPLNKENLRSPVPRGHADVAADFPFSVLAKTMRAVITNEGEELLAASPNTGRPELREAIRAYLARSRGIMAEAEQIVIGSGSEHLYGRIVELLGRNKKYAIESPSYKKIEQVYRAAGAVLEKLPLGHEGIETAALRACQADVLHVSPYRSYPSGVTASASKRYAYLRWANEKNSYIVEDDFESEVSVSRKSEETLFSIANGNNVIYMNTFSKTVSPSFRIGYMVLPKELLNKYEKQLGFYACTVPTYMQLVLAEIIANGDFERHINRIRRAKRREQQACRPDPAGQQDHKRAFHTE